MNMRYDSLCDSIERKERTVCQLFSFSELLELAELTDILEIKLVRSSRVGRVDSERSWAGANGAWKPWLFLLGETTLDVPL